MSSSILFLAGGVAFAFIGSILVWVVSRPRSRPQDPNELRNTLRNLHQNGTKRSRSGPPTQPSSGVREYEEFSQEQPFEK
ncbi:MAG: Uncharacterised protein [Acidimicrobiales bacterium AG-410-I20]|nr:MAG: Uncharacterised protein [Acidimicrobiales bacterium AG-410-I20]